MIESSRLHRDKSQKHLCKQEEEEMGMCVHSVCMRTDLFRLYLLFG